MSPTVVATLALGASTLGLGIVLWKRSLRVALLVKENHPDLQQKFVESIGARHFLTAERVVRAAVASRAASDPVLARAVRARRTAYIASLLVGIPFALLVFELVAQKLAN
jgi:hypothetical protein